MGGLAGSIGDQLDTLEDEGVEAYDPDNIDTNEGAYRDDPLTDLRDSARRAQQEAREESDSSSGGAGGPTLAGFGGSQAVIVMAAVAVAFLVVSR